MKATFFLAVLGAVAWFGKEVWPYVKSWIDDYQTRARVERAKRERDSSRHTPQ